MMKRPNRRTFMTRVATSGVVALSCATTLARYPRMNEIVRLGIIADLHGGFVRDSESRLDTFLKEMQSKECHGLVQLGDFAFPNEKHQRFADKFNAAHDTTIHVVGNHEFDFGLTREDCCKAWGIESSYYRKDIGGLRILVLDGNDQGSPSYEQGYPSFVGDTQMNWLRQQLDSSDKPVLILSHQPLAGSWSVDNAEQIQELFSKHRNKILLCINGHSHLDLLVEVGGVSYLHLNSASYFWVGGKHRTAFYQHPLYSLLTIDPAQGTISIQGKSSQWKGQTPTEMGYFENRKSAPPVSAVTPKIRNRKLSATGKKS